MYNDVIICSRVRIARNIKDYPFPPVLDNTGRKEIIEKVASALSSDYTNDEKIADSVYAHMLSEKNLISREFAGEKETRALFKNDNLKTYIMVCEEDHLRIQSYADGLNLEKAGENAITCERMLNEKINFAFSPDIGYLTRCPTNIGTAMRASVMMFLPALSMSNRMGDIKTQLEKIGMTIRGMYGEGSAAEACMFQISNRLSLGNTEQEILTKTETIAKRIAEDEQNARIALYNANKDKLTDKIMRSLGILKFAHMISGKEFLECYSYLRLGCALKLCNIPEEKLNSLLYSAMPAHIIITDKNAENSQVRDILRAKIIKDCLI